MKISRFLEAVEIARLHEASSPAQIEWDFLEELDIDGEEFLEFATAVIARVACENPNPAAAACTVLLRGILIGRKMEALAWEAPDHA